MAASLCAAQGGGQGRPRGIGQDSVDLGGESRPQDAEWNCARRALQAEESEAAGREGRKPVGLPHMVTHDLRHFYASALIAGGASVKQVQMVLGHASAVITLRIYAHLWPGEEDRTRSVMDAVLGGLRTGCGPVGDMTSETAGQTA